ncbi:unnamed protein product, partial [Heterotrigona itama]
MVDGDRSSLFGFRQVPPVILAIMRYSCFNLTKIEARDSYDPLNLSHPLRLGTRVEPVVVTGAGSEGAREGCRMKGKRDHT